MNIKYEIRPLTEEEETFIEEKISVYGDSMAPSEPHTEEEAERCLPGFGWTSGTAITAWVPC